MAAHEFPTLWNLAFYEGHEPNYIYFHTLYTTHWEGNETYNTLAPMIGDIGTAALSHLPSFAKESDTLSVEWLNQIIEFMEQAVNAERKAEIAYFNNYIKQLKSPLFKDFPQVQELIQELNSSSENVNYDKIITLINLIYQGLKNTQALVKSEKEHIEKIESAMAQIRGDKRPEGSKQTARYNMLSGLWNSKYGNAVLSQKYDNFEKFLEASNKKRQKQIMVQYTKHGNLGSKLNDNSSRKLIPGVKRWLLDNEALESTDVKIAHWITQTVNDIINDQDTFNKVVAECEAHYNFESKSQSEVEKAVKEFLIRGVTSFATKHINKILQGVYRRLDMNKLADVLLDSIEIVDSIQIEGMYDNFGQFGNTIKLLDEAKTLADLKDETRSAEGLYQAYKAFRTELNRLKRDKKRPTESQNLLKKLLKTNTDNDEYQKIFQLISQLESLENKLSKYEGNREKIQAAIDAWNKNPITVTDTSGETIAIRLKLDANGSFDFQSLKDSLKNSQLMEKLGGPGNRAKTLSTFISRLKYNTSTTLKQDIINNMEPLIQYAEKKGLGGEEYVLDSIRKAIGNIKISVGGPTFSEIKVGIQQSLQHTKDLKFWTGKINRKNDFITISANWEVPSFQNALRKAADTNAQELIRQGQQTVQKVSDIIFKNFQETFYDTITDLNKMDSTVNSYRNNAEAFFTALEKRNQILQAVGTEQLEVNKDLEQLSSQIKKENINENDLFKQREAIIQAVENSFYVSSTMKTYNQYQNQIGFVGGSLGSNVMEQLINLSEIFELAGVPISDNDLDWLYSAILNCFPQSVVGEKYKNIIEDYLGSLAAFALFDEGGAEAKIIRNMMNNAQDTYSTPQILHIYAVNGIYHPGSYVLQKVVDELKLCLQNAGEAYESTHHGAGITIVNTVNEGMVPNRGKEFRESKTPKDTDPWGTVGNKAESTVSLKILFLAGLLDTVHNMDDILSKIELPK